MIVYNYGTFFIWRLLYGAFVQALIMVLRVLFGERRVCTRKKIGYVTRLFCENGDCTRNDSLEFTRSFRNSWNCTRKRNRNITRLFCKYRDRTRNR